MLPNRLSPIGRVVPGPPGRRAQTGRACVDLFPIHPVRYRLAMAEPEHARRTYRHRDTGEEVHLSAGHVIQHSGRWSEVRLVRADGRPGAVAGQMPIA
jgi:hypothetical protein